LTLVTYTGMSAMYPVACRVSRTQTPASLALHLLKYKFLFRRYSGGISPWEPAVLNQVYHRQLQCFLH
jgi:hypothetical protein